MSRPGWGSRSRDRREAAPRRDPWTANDSALDHWLLLRGMVRGHAGPQHSPEFITRATDLAFREHLDRCEGCARQVRDNAEGVA